MDIGLHSEVPGTFKVHCWPIWQLLLGPSQRITRKFLHKNLSIFISLKDLSDFQLKYYLLYLFVCFCVFFFFLPANLSVIDLSFHQFCISSLLQVSLISCVDISVPLPLFLSFLPLSCSFEQCFFYPQGNDFLHPKELYICDLLKYRGKITVSLCRFSLPVFVFSVLISPL